MSQKQLWAPWRLNYILNSKEEPAEEKDQCFICRYREEAENDPENYVVERTESTITLLNRFPYNNGHLLIAPLAHKADFSELNEKEMLEISLQLQKMTLKLKEVLSAQGFNIGLNLGQVAGAGLPGHLHWHIVPRWEGDTNFMSVIDDITVIPQSLQALYDLLTKE